MTNEGAVVECNLWYAIGPTVHDVKRTCDKEKNDQHFIWCGGCYVMDTGMGTRNINNNNITSTYTTSTWRANRTKNTHKVTHIITNPPKKKTPHSPFQK